MSCHWQQAARRRPGSFWCSQDQHSRNDRSLTDLHWRQRRTSPWEQAQAQEQPQAMTDHRRGWVVWAVQVLVHPKWDTQRRQLSS